MGGINSGRPRSRAYLGQLLSLPIGYFRGTLDKAGASGSCKWSNGGTVGVAIREGRRVGLSFAVDGAPVRQEIATTATPCHYGGARDWFLCPSCGRRVGRLYCYRRRFVCRSCTGLAYRSQSESLEARLYRRHDYYRRRINPESSEWCAGIIPGRPERMHRATYARLYEKARRAAEAREVLLGGRLERLLATLEESEPGSGKRIRDLWR